MNRQKQIGFERVDCRHAVVDIDGGIVLTQEDDLGTERLQFRLQGKDDRKIAVLFVIALMGTGCQRTALRAAVTRIEDDGSARERFFGGKVGFHRFAQGDDDI